MKKKNCLVCEAWWLQGEAHKCPNSTKTLSDLKAFVDKVEEICLNDHRGNVLIKEQIMYAYKNVFGKRMGE